MRRYPDTLDLWGRFDEISSDLVRAKRRLREGRGSEEEVLRHRIELMAIRQDLGQLGQFTVDPEVREEGVWS
jgi:hypothetical protein